MSSEARVSPNQVKAIVSTELEDAQIYAFINTAHVLVDEKLADQDLSSTLLTEIELWLSAHFLSMRDQRVHEESIGTEYKVKYQGTSGQGLEATTYGQQALALDYTGTLANLGKKKAAVQVF